MTVERVRRAAARAAVTASRKTGRPVHPRVAALASCEDCPHAAHEWGACSECECPLQEADELDHVEEALRQRPGRGSDQ